MESQRRELVDLDQIFLEIKQLNIYSSEEWNEYVHYFLYGANSNHFIISQSLNHQTLQILPNTLAKRMKSTVGAKPEVANFQLSPKIITTEYFAHSEIRKDITLGVLSGCYDLLHLNHLRGVIYANQFLQAYPNPLLCALILSDQNIRAKKGASRPILNINERLEMLCHVKCIDYVIPLGDPDCLRVLETLRPEFLFKSETDSQQEIVRLEMTLVESYGGSVVMFPTFCNHGLSTTQLIETILTSKT